MIGHPIDADNLAQFTGMLAGGMSKADLALMASDTGYNTDNIGLASLEQVGLYYHYQGDVVF